MLKILLLIAFFISNTAAFSSGCDLVGKTYDSISKTNLEHCFQSCKSNKICKGAVFISNWNKCFLKSEIRRKVKINMYSKVMATEGVAQKDRDSTGKDLKNLLVKSSEECEKACKQEPACSSFTYIDAYSSCWLKKNKAKLIEKKFSCFIK